MSWRRTLSLLLASSSSILLAEDLPLPMQSPGTEPSASVTTDITSQRPTSIIRLAPLNNSPQPRTPVASAPQVTPPPARTTPQLQAIAATAPSQAVKSTPASRELALQELERRIMQEQVSRMIAEDHRMGMASALKKLIVVSGHVDTSVSLSPKPPTSENGKVSLIGLKDAEVARNVDRFFGSPMTPESEKALLDTVRRQLSPAHGGRAMDVSIAGWWPLEGVMAVSVMPQTQG